MRIIEIIEILNDNDIIEQISNLFTKADNNISENEILKISEAISIALDYKEGNLSTIEYNKMIEED